MLLSQFALYRARRYRLTRTVFRGVRFDQHGSAWRYALFALLWWTLAAVTLGLAYPWAQASLQRYKMRHTSYGDLHGSFAGSGSALFCAGCRSGSLSSGRSSLAVLALGRLVDWNALNAMMAQGDTKPLALLVGNTGLDVFVVVTAAIGTSIAMALLLLSAVCRHHDAVVDFRPAFRRHDGALAVVHGQGLSSLSALSALCRAVFARGHGRSAACSFSCSDKLVGSSHDSMPAELLASAVTLGIYVTMVLGASTIYQVVVTFAMWRLGVQSAELTGADALDGVRASGAPDSALGEGLVDALGVGGI